MVDPTAGVTRDRVTSLFHEGGRYFEMIDTGGIGIVDSDDLSADIERQIQVAIDEADLVLFVVDGRTGVTPLDREVADRIRRIDRPTILVVNKCDSEKTDTDVYEFLALMEAPLVRTSVKGNRNRKELRAAILEHLPPPGEAETSDGAAIESAPELKLAIVGRRNVGKSTFINALAETERMIVSEVAGTTRDSVDVRFELDGKAFVAIDTPGVRKKKSLANDIEFYGLVRAQKSIRRADVVLMFFDASQTISQVDKQLVEFIRRYYKPCVFVVNKWDLGLDEEMTTHKWADYLAENVRHSEVRPDGVHHRERVPQHQETHQPDAGTAQAVADSCSNRTIEQGCPSCRRYESASFPAQPVASRVLCRPGRHRAADHRREVQRSAVV